MKTIGLIGGMSWASTVTYYRLINEAVNRRLGGLHSARLALWSVDFDPIEEMQNSGAWDEAAGVLTDAARRVESAGADFLVLCTNTMHRVAEAVEDAVEIPLLHIADATAEHIQSAGIQAVGLLGTRFTMEQDFYRGRLEQRHGLNVLVPDETDRQIIHDVIYQELCHDRVVDASRDAYRRIINALVQRGAKGIILGCTEIELLVKPGDSPVPMFDTTAIHAEAAVDHALR